MGQDVAVSGSETIAVVIPTFNSQATIRRALDSVRNQTLAPTEIIVVDNASTDSTCEEVERFATSWSEMKLSLIRLDTNLGPGKARNIGWESCSTSLIAFLDSDDSWHPRKLELQMQDVAKHPNSVLFGHQCQVLDGNDQVVSVFESQQARSHRYSLWHFLIRNRLSTPTVMIRTNVPQRFPTDLWHAEDFSLWTQIVAGGSPAVISEDVLTYLHKPKYGSGGLSKNLKLMHQGEVRVLAQLRDADHLGFLGYFVVFFWIRVKYLRRRALGVST